MIRKLVKAFISGKDLIVAGISGDHIFKDFRYFRLLLTRIEKVTKSAAKLNQSQSNYLFKLLEPLTFESAWIKPYSRPMYYRRVGRLIDVLDTAGSLSDGGRYNIGGAQTSSTAVKEFGNIGRKKSALYICEDLKGVRKEYGDEGMAKSTAVTYEVKAATSDALNLIEIDAVLISLSSAIPNIADLVAMSSMAGTWVDIKYPAPTQILAHWLRKNAPENTDGIRFKSAVGNYYNVCLFFHDARECKARLFAVVHE